MMMTKHLVATLTILLCLGMASTSATAKKVAGVSVPETLEVAGTELALNGAGLRTKAIIKLYVGALYTAAPSSDASGIIAADDTMALWLRIRSGLLTQEKMEAALLNGFKKATDGNMAPIQSGVDKLLSLMKEPIKKKDIYTLAYDPAAGTRVSKNGQELGVIEGLPFKKALFGIWLSDKPIQAKLKKAMLGGS